MDNEIRDIVRDCVVIDETAAQLPVGNWRPYTGQALAGVLSRLRTVPYSLN